MPATYLMWLEAPEIASSVRPGQFAMVRCDAGIVRVLRRPLTIHQVEGDRVAFLYRVTGDGTGWLAERGRGDNLDVLGPLGNGFTIDEQASRALLVAGGIGLAPLRFLADCLVSEGREVTLLLGSRTASHLYPRELLPGGLKLVTATEDGSVGEEGLVTPLVGRYGRQAGQVFACGPEAMYRALAQDRNSLPPGLHIQVSLEVRMGCGVGACLSCTIKTKAGNKHVCKDGPVFDLDEVVWGETPVCAL